MKKIDSIRKIAEAFISKHVMTQEHSKLILKSPGKSERARIKRYLHILSKES